MTTHESYIAVIMQTVAADMVQALPFAVLPDLFNFAAAKTRA